MSILIKGADMPDKCGQCPCFHHEYPMYCQATKESSNKTPDAPYGMPRPDWCPLLLPNNKINKLMMSLEETIKNEREMAVKSLSLSVDNPRHIESVHNAYANGMENALEYIIYYLGDFIDECDN